METETQTETEVYIAATVAVDYYVEAYPDGSAAVMRRGVKGGKRTVARYTSRNRAERIAERLQDASNEEV